MTIAVDLGRKANKQTNNLEDLDVFRNIYPFYSQMNMVINVCECMHNVLDWSLTVCMLFVTLRLMVFTVHVFMFFFSFFF